MEDDSLAQAWQRVCDAAGIDTTGLETVREVESLVRTGRNYLAELRAVARVSAAAPMTQQAVESYLLNVTEVRESEPRFTIIVDENCAESAVTTSELADMVARATAASGVAAPPEGPS